MSKVALVTDSTGYIPKDLVEQYHINVAPQILIWGEQTFLDGIDITPEEFYTRLSKATIMPTTSQVNVASFQQIFTQLVDEGYEILAILLSTHFSKTIDSALQAREMFPGAPIEIVDSKTTAMAMGFQVLAAARLAEQGASVVECKALAEKATNHVGVLLTVDTLEFLHRGGRIGGGQRFLGSALNIKPILEVRGGRIEAVERVRTRRKSLLRLVELVKERIGDRKPIRLASLHANAHDDAMELFEQAKKQLNIVESIFSEVSPVVGTHAGPGTVGLAFMAGM